jgi:hypothetical protein
MDKQEIFNKVCTHLMTQNKRSFLKNRDWCEECAYRGDGELMCAVGCLIKDEHYSPSMETRHVTSSPVADALVKSGVPNDVDTIDMLVGMQEMHDRQEPEFWPMTLLEMARSEQLEVPEVVKQGQQGQQCPQSWRGE